MNITVICVGKIKEKFFTDAISEYLKRLSRFAKTEVIEVRDEKIPENAKIYAQCMLDDEAFEVTDKVNIENNRLVLEGKLLRLWGRSKKALGYKEDPAVAIKIVIED